MSKKSEYKNLISVKNKTEARVTYTIEHKYICYIWRLTMGDWVKCPRCDLNYMRKGEEYCDVCKAELKKAPPLIFAVDEDDDVEALELCPVCHQNYVRPNEKMCAKCAEEKDYKSAHEEMDDDESWKEYLDDEEEEEEEDEDMLSLNKLAEEEGDLIDEEEEEEEIEEYKDADDFDVPEIDESDFEDTDEEDEEEEEEDEDF